MGKQSEPDPCQSRPPHLSLPFPARGWHSRGLPSGGLPTLRVGQVQAFEDAGAARAHPESVFDSLEFWGSC